MQGPRIAQWETSPQTVLGLVQLRWCCAGLKPCYGAALPRLIEIVLHSLGSVSIELQDVVCDIHCKGALLLLEFDSPGLAGEIGLKYS